MQVPIKLKLASIIEPPCKLKAPDELLIKVDIDESAGTATIHAENIERMIKGHAQKCLAVSFEPSADCEVEFSNPAMLKRPNNQNPVHLHAGKNPKLLLNKPSIADQTTYWFNLPTKEKAEVGTLEATYLMAVQKQPVLYDPQIVVP